MDRENHPIKIEVFDAKFAAGLHAQAAGKLVAEISISGDKSSTTMILPDAVAEDILRLAKNAIIDGVEKAANDFIFEITTSIPETLKIGS